jgi:DNA-binding CsgD family transcriptional regulator
MASVTSAETFVAACVSSDQMPFALEQLSHSVGAEGAVLIRSRGPVVLDLAASASLVDDVASYADGNRPPDPRAGRVTPLMSEAFRVDADDFSDDEIGRDPFYQDFLAPRGLGWHACALLAGGGAGDSLHLSFKRKLRAGPFAARDLAMLTTQLPLLRAAVAFSRRAGGEGFAHDRLLTSEGRGLYGIDADLRVSVLHSTVETEHVIGVRRGRFAAVQRRDQGRLEAVLAGVRARRPQAVLLHDAAGRRWALRVEVSPAGGQVGPFEALAVLICLDIVSAPGPATARALLDLFALSPAEARIAVWIAQGFSIDDVAVRLAIRPGTVRNHLKAIFHKMGVSRQTQLGALVLRL